MANYHQAPLPFTGQKRNFIRHFTRVLQENIPGNGEGWTIVDAFGGSGLLSHHAKQAKPAARVIYNDHDGYARRLAAVPDTNRLRGQLAAMLADIPRNAALSVGVKTAVVDLLTSFDGFIDIDCAQSWLLFSGQQAESLEDLCRRSMYNCIRRTDYPTAEGYLDGVEIVSESYETLLPQYTSQSNTLLVLDPPYVCTAQGAYRNATYFGMVKFLRLMGMVRPPFIFFSSTRSELSAYLDYIVGEKAEGWERLKGYETVKVNARMNYSSRYEDNMVFRF